MTSCMRTLIGLTVLVAVFAGTLLAQDADAPMVDNPQYANWSSFEVGAMAKMKMTVESMGMQVAEMVITQTLTSLDANMAVVSMQTTMSINGTEMAQPATDIQIPAKVPVSAAEQPDENVETDIQAEEGQQTVEVPAGKFDCKFVKTTMITTVDGQKQTNVSTVWTSDQVPGGQVKMISVSQGDMNEQTTRSELIDYSTGSE